MLASLCQVVDNLYHLRFCRGFPIFNFFSCRLCWLQNVKLIRIDYWVEKIETGVHIAKDVIHTDNQIRRARCWFPCMDDSSQRCW